MLDELGLGGRVGQDERDMEVGVGVGAGGGGSTAVGVRRRWSRGGTRLEG